MKKIFLYLAFVSFFLSACSSNEVMKPTGKVGSQNGVIVASVTKSGLSTDAWFYYKKSGTNDEKRMDAVGLVMFKAPDDFPKEKNKVGRLLTFEVPAGKYDLTRWEVYTGVGYIRPKKIEPLPFFVKAGQVTYLGNLHIDTLTGKNVFGVRVPAAAIANIANEKDLDLPLLKRKYPNLSHLPVNLSVPKVSRWGLK